MRYLIPLTASLSFFANTAFAAESSSGMAAATSGAAINQTVMLVVLFIAFYFMLIRPQTKRAKAHQQLIKQLAEGDEVVTTGGLMGSVRKISEDCVFLNVAQGVELKVQKNAVSQVLPKGMLKGIE